MVSTPDSTCCGHRLGHPGATPHAGRQGRYVFLFLIWLNLQAGQIFPQEKCGTETLLTLWKPPRCLSKAGVTASHPCCLSHCPISHHRYPASHTNQSCLQILTKNAAFSKGRSEFPYCPSKAYACFAMTSRSRMWEKEIGGLWISAKHGGLYSESENENQSVVSDSLWPHGLYSLWNSPGQNTGVGSCSLLQRIFTTWDWTQVSRIAGRFFSSWATKGNPRILEWGAYPFFSESARPWNWTRVSCIAGRFFTSWATGELFGEPLV